MPRCRDLSLADEPAPTSNLQSLLAHCALRSHNHFTHPRDLILQACGCSLPADNRIQQEDLTLFGSPTFHAGSDLSTHHVHMTHTCNRLVLRACPGRVDPALNPEAECKPQVQEAQGSDRMRIVGHQ